MSDLDRQARRAKFLRWMFLANRYSSILISVTSLIGIYYGMVNDNLTITVGCGLLLVVQK